MTNDAMHWTQRPLWGFDLETTSADPLTARMVQAALVHYNPDRSIRQKLFGLINPGCAIPEEATAVHGITTARAQKGTDITSAIAKMLVWFANAERDGAPVVIFNAGFDWPCFQAEARRQGAHDTPRPLLLDPLVIDRKMDKYRKGKRNLATMAAHYGVTLTNAHSALGDVTATVAVMHAIVQRYPALQDVSLVELQSLQEAWYAEWRDHINQYWASKGEAKKITGSWLRPGEAS